MLCSEIFRVMQHSGCISFDVLAMHRIVMLYILLLIKHFFDYSSMWYKMGISHGLQEQLAL